MIQEPYEQFKKRFDYILKKVVGKRIVDGVEIDGVQFTNHQKEMVEKFAQLAYKREKSICLLGLPSTSKTTLFYVLQKAICQPNVIAGASGGFKIIPASAILTDFIDNGLSSFKQYDQYNVCIDDFGNSDVSIYHKGNKYLMMGDFIEHRYNLSMKKKLFTHLSSNLVPNKTKVVGYTGGYDIKDFLGERGYSRFSQTHEIVNMGFTIQNVINYRELGYPMPNFNYVFDWKAYLDKLKESDSDNGFKIMEGVLVKAIEIFKNEGTYNDYGSGLFKHLMKKNDEVLLNIIKDNKDIVISKAKEQVLADNKKLVRSGLVSMFDIKEKHKEIARQEKGKFADIEINTMINQLYLDLYLKYFCSI